MMTSSLVDRAKDDLLEVNVVDSAGNDVIQTAVSLGLLVWELKQQICEHTGTPVEWQRLVGTCGILEDNEHLHTKSEGGHLSATLVQQMHKQHLNIAFLGHLGSGRKTLCAQVLLGSGCIAEDVREKHQELARRSQHHPCNPHIWVNSYLDNGQVSEPIGKANFTTWNCSFTMFVSPTLKNCVPNMLRGASQIDVAVMVVSARKGEFETGFERGGQIGEFLQLARSLGARLVIAAINKMDDVSVEWQKHRYDEIVSKLKGPLQRAGFPVGESCFLPVSAADGDNIVAIRQVPCWYTGQSLLDTLDSFASPDPGKTCAPFRVVVRESFQVPDGHEIVLEGRVEQGTIRPNSQCILMPGACTCFVKSVYIDEREVSWAPYGENVSLRLAHTLAVDIQRGSVLCPLGEPLRAVSKVKVKLRVVRLRDNAPVMTAGFKAFMHVHLVSQECEIVKLYEAAKRIGNTTEKEKNPMCVGEDTMVLCSIAFSQPVAIDTFSSSERLGQFTLRGEGCLLAFGKVVQLPKYKDTMDFVRVVLTCVYRTVSKMR